jgi:cephalosporin hydroxylase
MKYLEESGSTPLAQILPIIQDRIVNSTFYFGVQTQKNPLDFWVYQELIHELRPTLIIEIGNNFGGSALALAHLLDLLGNGRLIAVDINHDRIHDKGRAHPRISLIEGDACSVFDQVASMVRSDDRILVIEDSSHTYENTLRVVSTYSGLLRTGEYFIVEDSICHHGLDVGPDPGPFEAIEDFVKGRDDFTIDRSRESFLITWNPKGFLVKTSRGE